MGGFIVDATSWKYIFLINVPIGLITLFYAFKMLPKTHKVVKGKLDGLGAILFMFTIVPLFVALGQGQKYGFTHPIILLGLLVAIICFAIFILVEKRRFSRVLRL